MPGEERLIKWSEAEELFCKNLAARLENGKSANTNLTYLHRLKTLKKVFGKRILQSIERYEVEAWRDERKKAVGASDINCTLSVLDMLYNMAVDRFNAKRVPQLQAAAYDIARVKRLKLPAGRDNILENEDQIQTLLSECKTPVLYHFVYGILNTGLRHTDMLKLRASEIAWERNEIVTLVKGGKQVRIPLTEAYRLYLKDWILKTRPTKEGWLFPSRMRPEECYNKQSRIGYNYAIERCAEKYEAAGDTATAERFRNLRVHDLRHTFATHFLYKMSKSQGASAAIHILSEALGHSDSFITQRYSHSLDEVNQAAMKEFGKAMWSNLKPPNFLQSV
jgi:integrase